MITETDFNPTFIYLQNKLHIVNVWFILWPSNDKILLIKDKYIKLRKNSDYKE